MNYVSWSEVRYFPILYQNSKTTGSIKASYFAHMAGDDGLIAYRHRRLLRMNKITLTLTFKLLTFYRFSMYNLKTTGYERTILDVPMPINKRNMADKFTLNYINPNLYFCGHILNSKMAER